jgi:hypothetical protein
MWPEGDDGNGHNKDDGINYWRGKRIISVEEWKRIAGYTDLDDVLTPWEQEELTERLKWKGGDLQQEQDDMSRVSEILAKSKTTDKKRDQSRSITIFS